MKSITHTEKRGFLFLAIVLLISLFFGYSDVTYFDTKIAQEDGAVEYSTAILLVCIVSYASTDFSQLAKINHGFGNLEHSDLHSIFYLEREKKYLGDNVFLI